MKSDVAVYKRRSIRLKEYDYSQNGVYFVTICTQNSKKVFGNIFAGEMRLNEYGKIVENEWIKTRALRISVLLEEFTIMPNHFHGIIILMDDNCRGTARRAPTVEKFGKPVRGSLPTIVRFSSQQRLRELMNCAVLPVLRSGRGIITNMLFEMKIS